MNSLFWNDIFDSINWWWFGAAVIVSYLLGMLWHSWLFKREWLRLFGRGNENETMPSCGFVRIFLTCLVAMGLLGLALTIMTKVNIWLAVAGLIGFASWDKSTLAFRFPKFKEYIAASIVQTLYFCLIGAIFILFAVCC